MEAADYVVSEVHSFSNEKINGDKMTQTKAVLSRFDFTYPLAMRSDTKVNNSVQVDSDGDLEVTRKSSLHKKDDVVLIEHQSATTLDLVGEQVWRGAFFLSDFILHNWQDFKDTKVLEVASGVGLTSVVAAMVAKTVIATDIDRGDILELLRRNLERNKDLCSAKSFVRVIDFFNLTTLNKISPLIHDVDIVLVADVVYNDKLTDAFFDTVLKLIKPNRIFYVALEKRYVFTIEDLDTVAPCYEHFVSKLDWLKSKSDELLNIEQLYLDDIPQYFAYERTKELVLWKISS